VARILGLMGERADKTENELQPTSSKPAAIPEEQQALFRDVLALLEWNSVPYAVAGAFALRQHTGICRFTKDLDIFLTTETAPAALAILHEQGFTCEIRDEVWLAKAHRDDYFVDLITGMSNGVISVDASWIERARPARIFGVETRVLAPEELIASKLFVTRRERFDGADIAHVIFARKGELDWERVLRLAGEHWELVLWALMLFRYVYPEQTGYVPREVWEDLLAQLVGEVCSPPAKAKFRGSLIDNIMFAIDVDEWGMEDLYGEARKRCPKIGPMPLRKRV
jgi:Uncharacterised nucleotidyltransferase